jgi:hypothetical protein
MEQNIYVKLTCMSDLARLIIYIPFDKKRVLK